LKYIIPDYSSLRVNECKIIIAEKRLNQGYCFHSSYWKHA